jgi:hypothetical protein
MLKIFALLLILNFNNCVTKPVIKEVYKHSPSSGCAVYTKNDERLKCLSSLIAEFEDLQNSEILVENEPIGRYDEEYVTYKETYCYVSPKTNRKYLCFESIKNLYEPTNLGKIWGFTKTVGFGAIIGFIGGVYVPH